MQAVNAAAITPVFMAALFAPAAAGAALLVGAVRNWPEVYARYLLAGSALYLLGAIGLTIAYHVPRNEALARVDPHSSDAAQQWTRYVSAWTAGNHVRTVAAIAAAAALVGALTTR